MKNERDSLDKVLESLIDDAAIIAENHIGKNILEPTERIEFSKEHEVKMHKLFRKEHHKILMKKVARYSKHTACFLLVMIIVSGVTIFSVSALRVRFLNFVLEIGQQNTDINFGEDKGDSYATDDITLGYIPKEFVLEKSNSREGYIFIKFKNDDEYFTFSLNKIDGSTSIDTESADVSKITINNMEAFYSSKDDVNILVWHNDEYSFQLAANIEEKEIIKIAENIKK